MELTRLGVDGETFPLLTLREIVIIKPFVSIVGLCNVRGRGILLTLSEIILHCYKIQPTAILSTKDARAIVPEGRHTSSHLIRQCGTDLRWVRAERPQGWRRPACAGAGGVLDAGRRCLCVRT